MIFRFLIFATFLLLGALLTLSPQKVGASSSDIKTLYPVADAWLDRANPNSIDNSSAELFIARDADGIIQKDSVVKFDLSSLPADAHITSAVFNLFLKDCSGNYAYLNIGQVGSQSWTESTATWNSNFTYWPWVQYDQATCQTGRWYYIGVNTMVTNWLSGQPNNGFLVMPISGLAGQAYNRTFYSRHSSSFKPQLVLAYTYTPASSTPPPADTPAVDPANSSSSSSSSSSPSTQTGIISGSNAAPSTSTSSSIAAPANLTATDVAGEKPAIKLSWEKSSTTNISGYKIFRSEKEKEDFKDVAVSDINTLEYTDDSVESGKTYYYFVRAYKDKLESASSNTVTLSSAIKSVLAETEEARTAVSAEVKKFDWRDWKSWNWKIIGLGAALALLIGFLIIYEILLKKRSQKPIS